MLRFLSRHPTDGVRDRRDGDRDHCDCPCGGGGDDGGRRGAVAASGGVTGLLPLVAVAFLLGQRGPRR